VKIGILTIGNELVSGMIQDRNASFIAREMKTEGWRVVSMMSVGDDEHAIAGGLDHVMGLADAVIVTGGLGPTADDITTAAIARCLGLPLHTDKSVLRRLKKRFESKHLPWTDNNAKQARFPEGAQIIDNPVGSACGFYLERGEKIVTVLPGVPDEIHWMLPEGLIPVLRWKFNEGDKTSLRKTIKLFGMTESSIDTAIGELDLALPGITIGSYPRFPEIHIVVTSVNRDERAAAHNLELVTMRIAEGLKKHIFAWDYETMEGIVARYLTDHGRTLAVAESCTGGLIADRLTNVPGSSDFFERGVVSYSNASKVELLGVPQSTISRYGAVSEPTAVAMAEGIRKISGTHIGLSTTGIAGPAGGTSQKPVGTVFVSLTDGDMKACREFLFGWDRRRIKEISAQWALEMLRRHLVGRDI